MESIAPSIQQHRNTIEIGLIFGYSSKKMRVLWTNERSYAKNSCLLWHLFSVNLTFDLKRKNILLCPTTTMSHLKIHKSKRTVQKIMICIKRKVFLNHWRDKFELQWSVKSLWKTSMIVDLVELDFPKSNSFHRLQSATHAWNLFDCESAYCWRRVHFHIFFHVVSLLFDRTPNGTSVFVGKDK